MLRHPFRVFGRVLWLGAQFTVAAVDYLAMVAFRKREVKRVRRGLWLQRNSRRVLRVANVDWRVTGQIPKHGLLISNHLSYLDILVFAAITPAVFVSKEEVRRWPVLGWFARIGGTIFVRREKRGEVFQTTREMNAALDDGALVVLFPEGTSSNGQTVLPFKSSLLEPAATTHQPLYAGCIGYTLDDGDVVEEVYYWRDMTLFPHLVNLLGKRQVSAQVTFAPFEANQENRKQLAGRFHAEILRLKGMHKPPAR